MTESTKNIATTMEGNDRREAVEAMANLLDKLKQLPDWSDGKIEFTLKDGRSVEVSSQEGNFEAFRIYVN